VRPPFRWRSQRNIMRALLLAPFALASPPAIEELLGAPALRRITPAFRIGQGAGGIPAQQVFGVRPVHGSHLPPIRSSNCFRQR